MNLKGDGNSTVRTDRPGSGKSQFTTVTAGTAPTAFTGNQTQFSAQTAANIVIDPSKKLTEYIKYDPALGRDQHIGMGKESNLDNVDVFQPQGGVSLTQFAPFRDRSSRARDPDEESEVPSEHLTFEQKMERRHESEAY